YYIEQYHRVEQVPVTIQQGLIYGVTVGKTHWLYREGPKPARSWRKDSYGKPVSSVSTKTVVLRDGPSYEPWDVYDAWWDPDGRDVDTCSYIVLQSWLTKEKLQQNACTLQQGHDPNECDGLYHNLEQLFQTGTRTGRPDVTAQERALSSSNTNLRKN